MGRRLRRFAAAVLSTALLAGVLVLSASSPADAAKVGNPGSGFTLRVQEGFLRIKEESFDFNDENRLPQCSDGSNNDDGQDTGVDFPADGQCSSAADDSEVVGGFQPKLPIQLTNGSITGAGAVTFPMSGVSFPNQYIFVPDAPVVGDIVVTVKIIPTHDVTGTLDANTGAMSLRIRVRVSATGGPISDDCGVGSSGDPIDMNMMITGTTAPPGPNTPVSGAPYDAGTGRVTLVNNSFSVPGASNCSAVFVSVNNVINDELGIPSAAGNNEAKFVAEFIGTRPQPSMTASFTASPSSGPAPLITTLNASGSTGAGITYQWDFTNNGSFDASGVNVAATYLTPGAYTARLRVNQGSDFVETTRLITVGNNLPPTANDQTVSTPEETATAITLTGSDPEGLALTYTRVAPNPTNGSVTCTGTACTYTPNADVNGTDTFGFRVTDNFGNTDDGVVSVNVTPVNDAPTTSNVSAATTEDVPVGVNLVANDIDGDALTYEVVAGPTKGSLSGTAPALTYTPGPDENGPDSFTYRVTDPSGVASGPSTASISITAVNDAPVADDQVGDEAVAAVEDTPVGVTLSGSDVDGSIIYGIVTPPSHGTLSGALPNLTYTPAANYDGPDSFTFKVTDSSGATDNGTVDLEVAPANDAPTTTDRTLSATEDTPVEITIVGNDVDGDALTFTPSASSAEGGTVTCAADVCTYTPAPGFSGPDSFTVDVSDGTATVTSTVSVSVSALNNTQPVVNDSTVVVLEDAARSFTIPSYDADGDPRTYTVVSEPADGTLSCSATGACTYVPTPDANGARSLTVLVTDGRGGSDTADITLSIVPLNDSPVLDPQTLVTAEDSAGAIDLVATDADGDPLTWTVKRSPNKGALSCTAGGTCTYTPNPNTNGSDSFEIEVDDAHGAKVRTTIAVSVAPVADPPAAGTVSRSVPEDGSVAFNLVGSDPDGTSPSFSASPATNGTLTCSSAGACTYLADPNAVGTETIAYTATDGTASVSGSIVITIVPVNDAPAAQPFGTSTPEDTPVAITLTAIDPDVGDPLTYTVSSLPGFGTLSGSAPNLTYTPPANASGSTSFTFAVRDLAGATSTASVSILVTPVDDLPVANAPSVTTAEDQAKVIPLTGSDAEGPITKAVTTPPAHGTYNAGSGLYTPATNYHGTDAIGFTVTDGSGQTTTGTIGITITPVNDPPVATDANVTTTRAVPVAVTLTGSDVDGPGTLTYSITTPPTKGTLSGTAPNLTYTPTPFLTGSDSITFTVTDAAGLVDSGTIGITITAGPALPTTLVVAPADTTPPSGLLGVLGKHTYTDLSARLTTTGGGLPVPNMAVAFKVGTTPICTGTTNADGVATCSGQAYRSNQTNGATTYTGTFAGNAGFVASTGTGSLT